ncbi:MAG: His-Xaa-Ser system protein HxsD [Rickettsiales bacterium]|nr:His-Xaa-Ser system protein HxsD [Rickettsiales bacterium]
MSSDKAIFDSSIFSLECVKKALYKFADKAGFEISQNGKEITVSIIKHSDDDNVNSLLNQLRNEVIDQDLRQLVAQETSTIRELILANAFSKTKMVDAA